MTNNQPQDFSSILDNLNNGADRRQTAQKLMQNMSADENRQLFEIMQDKDKLSALMSSPAAQKILEKINGHK